MYPILIQLGGFRLHSYGVLVALAIFAALWVGAREARRKGFARGVVDDLALPVIVAGFLGGRLAHVLGWEPELLWRDPLGILAVWRGGLAIHGALLAGFGAALWFCRRRRLDTWALADTLAPAIILGQAIGRFGCLLSGDSYGRPADLLWAVTFTHPAALAPLGVPLHPVQLYELAFDLVLFGVLWALRKRTSFPGQLFLLYVAGYGLVRLVTEVFRGDRVELAFGLSALQAASLALLAIALVAFGWRLVGRRART
ncbi:MAG: prolipoprotein diacylglyceryl transferase [Candidatus Rokubacteria bacterium]|nr:prolipoprotein diacylglyceryl transferase [Candidatus Rokubacteria bacterium]